jgi:predicted Zn-dependent peptidase
VNLIQLSESLTTNKFPASRHRLAQGLTVIHQYIPVTPVVVADIWVKAGAIAEPSQWSGIAHFLEHMIFKGTKRIAPGIFDQMIEHQGGMTNAATSHDYAHFFQTTSAPKLATTLPYLAEILLEAEIPDVEFYRERDVVLEELRSCYDDPDWIAFQSLCETIYQCHPYGRSVLGDETKLLQMTPNQMRCFHRTHYQPERMVVVIVGGVTAEEALATVERSFANFPIPSECPPTSVEAEPPLISVRRSSIQHPYLEQARLSMGWVGPGVEQLKDGFALDVLSVILAGGRTSRLTQELREEKQLVYGVNSCFSLQRDSSLFTINAWLEPEHLEEVEQIISAHLWQLQSHPVPSPELKRCQRLLCHDYIFSTETPGQLAGLYGYYETLARAELSLVYPNFIEQVTEFDLQRLAHQYLSPERCAVTIMRP